MTAEMRYPGIDEPVQEHAVAADENGFVGGYPLRLDLLAIVALLAVVLTVLMINIWSAYNLYRLDILTFYIPWYEHLGERLRDGDLPGWIPYVMSGAPFAGDPQSGWGYLPAMVIFTIAPSLSGYFAFLVFHVVLAALGTYLYARVIGIRPVGALAAGLVFTLGNFMERSACCTIHMQVAVWIPAIFLTLELGFRARNLVARLRWFLLAGVCTGQMVAGWIGQGAYYGCLAIGFYVAYRCLLSRADGRSVRDRIVALAIAGSILAVIGGAVAGPALLPRLEVVSRSNLSDLYEDEEDSSVETGWEIDTVPFRIFSNGNGSTRWYLGAVLLTAAVAGALLTMRRRHSAFFALFGLGIISLIIKHSPTKWPFELLPRFESLHIHSPDRIYVVLFLAPAILVGWLIHALLDRDRATQVSRTLAALAVTLTGAFVFLAAWATKRDRGYWMDDGLLLQCALVVGAVALALFIARPIARQIAVAVIIVLLIKDPAGDLARERIDDTERRDQLNEIVDETLDPNGAALWLQQHAETGDLFRFFGYDQVQLMNQGILRTYHVSHTDETTWAILVNNRGIEFQLHDIQGYNPVQIQRYVELFDAINGVDQSYHAANVLASGLTSPLLDQLNVRYIVVPATIDPGRPDLLQLSQTYPTVYADSESRILENPNALPRAWIVHDADQEETSEDILTKFGLRLADPRRSVLLVTDVPELEQPPADAIESVEVTSYKPDEIHIRVDAAATGMVVLSEIWDPGWTATVDGESVEVYEANYAFRGIVVEPGQHEIVMTFEPRTLRWSIYLYLIPVLGLALTFLIGKRRREAPLL